MHIKDKVYQNIVFYDIWLSFLQYNLVNAFAKHHRLKIISCIFNICISLQICFSLEYIFVKPLAHLYRDALWYRHITWQTHYPYQALLGTTLFYIIVFA